MPREDSPSNGPEFRDRTPEPSQDALASAYEHRTFQLHEARAALGEAVHTLRLELSERHREIAALRERNASLDADVERLRGQLAELERQLGEVRNMKLVRWTVWPRRMVYRLRDRAR